MQLSEIQQLQASMRGEDWASVYALLDRIRGRASTQDDMRMETYWRVTALGKQGRYDEAIALQRRNANLFNSQCLVHHNLARFLLKLGRDDEALEELKKAPIEEEMEDFYGLAIDAKFSYFYLLAKRGDQSVKDRLSEIPDDYRHITMGGRFLTKPDIVALLK
jgi:tetratricopeptide (TPR) repeat protein